jgi:hypothetical protein
MRHDSDPQARGESNTTVKYLLYIVTPYTYNLYVFNYVFCMKI